MTQGQSPEEPVRQKKRIALVAHDNKKQDLLEWVKFNQENLKQHDLCATGTTGKLLEQALDIEITKLQSGPLGGDQQVGAKVAGGEIDLLIFFWDPLEPQPHVACNRASADFIISSPLMTEAYERRMPDYETYRQRRIQVISEEDTTP